MEYDTIEFGDEYKCLAIEGIFCGFVDTFAMFRYILFICRASYVNNLQNFYYDVQYFFIQTKLSSFA